MTTGRTLLTCEWPNGCTHIPTIRRQDHRFSAPQTLHLCHTHGTATHLPPRRPGNAGPLSVLLLMLVEEHRDGVTLRDAGERLGIPASEVKRLAAELRLPVMHGRVWPAPVQIVSENREPEKEIDMENVELKERIVATLGNGPHTAGALARQIGVDTARLSMPLAHLARSKKAQKIGDIWELTPREVTAREHAEAAARAINDNPRFNAVAEVVDDHTVVVRPTEPPVVTISGEGAKAIDQILAEGERRAAEIDIPTRLRSRIDDLENDYRAAEKAIEEASIRRGRVALQIERHRIALNIVESLP